MGTSKYLDSVLRILPAIQAKQVYDLLQKLQVDGQIKDATEYESRLRELAAAINSSTPAPSFERIRAIVWNLCSSDLHNTMLSSAKNDIEALFLQVDEIGEKLSDHNLLFMEGVISDLNKVISEQEETILRLEWLKNSNNEFTTAISNTFTSSQVGKTERSELVASSLYFDNRTWEGRPKNELPDAFVSEKGNKLILNSANDTLILPSFVQEHFSHSSYQTEVSVDLTNIENMIDGERGTFWTKNIYLSETVPKVSTTLEFNLGASKDINYMILETGIPEAFTLEEVYGITYDGSKIVFLSNAIQVQDFKRIDFPKNNVSSVFITISTDTYKKTEYFVPADSSIHDAVNTTDRFYNLTHRKNLEPAIADALNSKSLQKVIGAEKEPEVYLSKFVYSFIIDNVWFGNSEYSDTSIFVSKSLKINNVGILGLNINAKEETGLLRNTLEFDIVKIDRFPKYSEQRFPILPIGSLSIPCERLVLTKRTVENNYMNTVGALRFCPHVKRGWDSGDPEPVKVYKNGVLLPLGSEWEFAISKESNDFDWKSSFLHANEFEYFTLPLKKMFIRILKPDESAVYTVSYTARSSDAYKYDTKLWLDAAQTIYLDRDAKVHFLQENPDITVESEVYLQITLRRNLPNPSSSPELNDYILLGASYV